MLLDALPPPSVDEWNSVKLALRGHVCWMFIFTLYNTDKLTHCHMMIHSRVKMRVEIYQNLSVYDLPADVLSKTSANSDVSFQQAP